MHILTSSDWVGHARSAGSVVIPKVSSTPSATEAIPLQRIVDASYFYRLCSMERLGAECIPKLDAYHAVLIEKCLTIDL